MLPGKGGAKKPEPVEDEPEPVKNSFAKAGEAKKKQTEDKLNKSINNKNQVKGMSAAAPSRKKGEEEEEFSIQPL